MICGGRGGGNASVSEPQVGEEVYWLAPNTPMLEANRTIVLGDRFATAFRPREESGGDPLTGEQLKYRYCAVPNMTETLKTTYGMGASSC